MAPTNIAIIGSGIWCKEEHLPAVEATDLLNLKAIFSRSLKSAKALAEQASNTDDIALYSTDAGEGKAYKDLLARDDISAFIIALPITDQPEYIEAALSAGKHVLAEKPIGPDVARAKKLIQHWENVSKENGVQFSIAENYRYIEGFRYAVEKSKSLGKLQHFSVRVLMLMNDSNRFYNTAWRAKPEYQGGFLLDGGVHFAAATRQFLRGDAAAESVQAVTSQAQQHLPPLDTVNAVVKLKNGATGVFQHSCGTTMKAFEWVMGYENGSVVAEPKKVVVLDKEGKEVENKELARTSGVKEEVKAWAEGLRDGKPDEAQSAKEGLADLEFLELMFRSGEEGGAAKKYELQH